MHGGLEDDLHRTHGGIVCADVFRSLHVVVELIDLLFALNSASDAHDLTERCVERHGKVGDTQCCEAKSEQIVQHISILLFLSSFIGFSRISLLLFLWLRVVPILCIARDTDKTNRDGMHLALFVDKVHCLRKHRHCCFRKWVRRKRCH